MNRLFKAFLIIIIIIASICINTNIVYAEDDTNPESSLSFPRIINKADEALEKAGDEGIDSINTNRLQNYSENIFRFLFIIGVALSVIVGGIIGIKFMVSSAEDKAKVKEIMIPYIIGCIVIFGAFGIWKVTVEILSNLNK